METPSARSGPPRNTGSPGAKRQKRHSGFGLAAIRGFKPRRQRDRHSPWKPLSDRSGTENPDADFCGILFAFCPTRTSSAASFRTGRPVLVGPDVAQLPFAAVALGEQHQRVAEQVFARDVLLQEQRAVDLVARVRHRDLDRERDFAAGHDLRGVEEHREQRRRARVLSRLPFASNSSEYSRRTALSCALVRLVRSCRARARHRGFDVVGRGDLLWPCARARSPAEGQGGNLQLPVAQMSPNRKRTRFW